MLGDQFTLADAYLFVILSWLPHFKIALDEWPQLSRYFTMLKQRASIQKSLHEEGMSYETH